MLNVYISDYFAAAAQKGYVQASVDLLTGARTIFDTEALMQRMERMNARRDSEPPVVEISFAEHPDAQLLRDRETMDVLWQREIEAWILQKKRNTPETAAMAREARAATAEIARQIELSTAWTPEGIEVKDRTVSWRCYGASFGLS